jgi:hypothetical protein
MNVRHPQIRWRPLVEELKKNSKFFTTESVKKTEAPKPFEFDNF